MTKSPDAFRTISEVSDEIGVPQHVLRFWETKFAQVKPLKRGGGRRYYRPADIEVIRGIQTLLYTDGYTIRGVQKVLRAQGVRFVAEVGKAGGIRLAPVAAIEKLEATDIIPAALVVTPAQVAPPAPVPIAAAVAQAAPVQKPRSARDFVDKVLPPRVESPAQLSLVEPPPVRLTAADRANFAKRMEDLAKLKKELGGALSARAERVAPTEAPRAARA